MRIVRHLSLLLPILLLSCSPSHDFDVLIRNGTVYDGSGGPGVAADVGIVGDSVVFIGTAGARTGHTEIDATGHAVAPGFINMLSWGVASLIENGRSEGDIRQGVTLEVFGEGESMGPLNDEMRAEMRKQQGDITFDIPWTTLDEYLTYLQNKGVSTNIASFVGATTVRVHEIGYEDRPPTPEELERMKDLVRRAMEDGAVGVGASLIYAPAFYAKTDELIALSTVAAEYGGRYIAHMRSEGNRLLEAVDEVIMIAREAGIGAEIYHLKAAGESNWSKLDKVIERVEAARSEGLDITADMYLYTAGATGFDAAMPPWVQEGGLDAWVERLKDPDTRVRVAREMRTPTNDWENLYLAAGSTDRVLVVGFKQDSLKYLTGKTLTEIMAIRGSNAEETIMDLIIDDHTRIGVVYFLMSEENVRKQIALPWMAFDSDAETMSPEGVFLKSNPHPRAYGNFARLLGTYVREEHVVPLEEAIRRLTSFPAENLKLERRGRLAPGYFADVVVFDPATIQDHATFDQPHQFSTGVRDVFVNGIQVLQDGGHTGLFPGKVVRGPGWKKTGGQ